MRLGACLLLFSAPAFAGLPTAANNAGWAVARELGLESPRGFRVQATGGHPHGVSFWRVSTPDGGGAYPVRCERSYIYYNKYDRAYRQTCRTI